MKTMPSDRIISDLEYLGFDISSNPKSQLLVDSLRERAKTLLEFIDMAKPIVNAPTSYDEKAVKKFLNDESLSVLRNYLVDLKANSSIDKPEEFESFTKDFMDKNEVKLKILAQPLRISMVGSAVSPSIYDTMSVIGYDELVKRIESLLDN